MMRQVFDDKFQMWRHFIDDDEMKEIMKGPLDLYKWTCGHESCQRFTKVWLLSGKEPFQGQIYAWLRLAAMEWIDPWEHFYFCGKHYKVYNRNPDLIRYKDHAQTIFLLKRQVQKRAYSVIQKINE